MIIDSPIISGSSAASGSLNQFGNVAITGSLTVTGAIIGAVTGSVDSASYASNAELLDGRDSTTFTSTSSFQNYTSSNDAQVLQLNNVSASLNSYTSSNNANIAALNAATASLYNATSSIYLATASLNLATASIYGATSSLFAYTASNSANVATLFATSASLNAAVADIRNATASLYNATASIYGATSSLFNYSASSNLRIGSLEQYTASLNIRSASFACIDSTNNFACAQYFSNASNAISFTSTGSLYSDGGMRITKDMYVSGTAYFNNVTVFGTQSINYITSSQLNIASNLITVNTSTPAVRFGGLAVYDSGSLGTGLTGSILWDSEANHWVYSNPSGSTYSGGMFISGPRSAALGSEQGTTACALMMGQGGDHITSSAIFHYGNATCFYGNAIINSTGSACFANTVCAPTLVVNNQTNISPDANGTGQLMIQGNGYQGYTALDATAMYIGHNSAIRNLTFQTNETNRLTINGDGIACFACQMCAPTIISSGTICSSGNTIVAGCLGIGTSSPSAKLDVAGNIFYSGVLASGGLGGRLWVPGQAIGQASNAGLYGLALTYLAKYDSGWKSVGGGYASAVTVDEGIFSFSNSQGVGAPDTALTWTTRLMVGTDGKVGIGTTSPTALLTLAPPTNTAGLQITNNNDYEIYFSGSSNSTTNIYNSAVSGSIYFSTNNGALHFGSSTDATHLTITGSNVGIGTTSPIGKLQVGGTSGNLLTVGTLTNDWGGDVAIGVTTGNGIIISKINTNNDQNRVLVLSRDDSGGGGTVIGYKPSGLSNAIGFRLQSTGSSYFDGGDVGIGNTSPTAYTGYRTLHIGDASRIGLIKFGTGTDANGPEIFTNSNNNLFFLSNNADIRMTISGSGNVGIGTSTPSNRLTVHQGGGVRVTGITNGSYIELSGDLPGYSANTYPVIKSNGTIHFANNGKYAAYLEGADTYFGIMDNAGSTKINLATNGASYFTGGNVGIGTTSPSYTLDVQSSISSEPYVQARFLNTNGSTPYGGILINGSNQAHIRFLTGTSTWGGAGAKQWQIRTGIASNVDALSIYSWTAGSDILYISGSGNVGIGTTSPGFKLDVSGNAAISGNVSIGTTYNGFPLNVNGTTYIIGGQLYLNVDYKVQNTSDNSSIQFSNDVLNIKGSMVPIVNGTQNLGSSSYRWGTVFTSDLSLSNGIGDYTIVEGENDLFLYNNKQNKVYKFVVEEVDPSIATPKKS